jgi:hypothetical protein
MIERVHSNWVSKLIQWLRPRTNDATLAWQRIRRALRSQPRRFVRSVPKGDMWRTL